MLVFVCVIGVTVVVVVVVVGVVAGGVRCGRQWPGLQQRDWRRRW
jgi:hypothetical protein